MRQPARTVYLSPQVTHVNAGRIYRIDPERMFGDGMAALLARIAAVADRDTGAVVVLDQGAHVELGFPEHVPAPDTEVSAITDAKNRGWHVAAARPWTTFWRPRFPTIHVAILPWLGPNKCALWDDDPAVLCDRLTKFHNIVGTAYHGRHSGLAGVDLMRLRTTSKHDPRWVLKYQGDDCPPVSNAIEIHADWTSPFPPDHEFVHGYDANLQYLAAAGCARLAVDAPQFADYRRPDGPHAAGCYLITVPEWELDWMPPPYGMPTIVDGRAWVDSSTMNLLAELSDETRNAVSFPEVHRAWVSSTTAELLKPWAGDLRDAIEKGRRSGDRVLAGATKMTYSTAIGMIDSTASEKRRIFRPDWAAAIRGTARTNLWRKVWAQFQADGRIPVSWSADTVYYSSPDRDPISPKSWPCTFKRRPDSDPYGAHLGKFKPYVKPGDK